MTPKVSREQGLFNDLIANKHKKERLRRAGLALASFALVCLIRTWWAQQHADSEDPCVLVCKCCRSLIDLPTIALSPFFNQNHGKPCLPGWEQDRLPYLSYWCELCQWVQPVEMVPQSAARMAQFRHCQVLHDFVHSHTLSSEDELVECDAFSEGSCDADY